MAKSRHNRSALIREFLTANPGGSAAEYNKQAPIAARVSSSYFHNLKSIHRHTTRLKPVRRSRVATAPPHVNHVKLSSAPALSAPRKVPTANEVRVAYTDHQLHAARAFAEEFGNFDAAIGALKTVQSLFATGLPRVADIV